MLHCETGMKKTAVRILCTAAVLLLFFGLFTGATAAVSGDKQPLITITELPEVLVQGEKLVVVGTAEGEPNSVKFYIFGTNKFISNDESVIGGEFTIELSKEETKKENLATGQYFLVIQHPMYDKVFNIGVVGKNIVLNENGDFKDGSVLFNTDERQSANAVETLCHALDSQNIDDIYVRASFIVAGPTSYIDVIPSSINKGDILTISGTTTGHKGEVVSVELLSTTFSAFPKEAVPLTSFVKQTTKIGNDGVWSVSIDSSKLFADEYTCSVAVGQLDASTSKITIVDESGSVVSTPHFVPTSYIYPIPAQITKGDFLTVSGCTVGYKDNIVSVELLSTAFSATPKEEIPSTSFVKQTTKIGNDGVWSVSFDTSKLNAAEYACSVILGQLDAVTSKITIIDESGSNIATPTSTVAPTQTYVATPTPTVNPTQIPTSAPVQTSVPTQQSTQSESSLTSASVSEVASDLFAGIGATPFIVAVALVVLGGVIVLLLRRK